MRKIPETLFNYGKMVKFSHTLFALPFAGLSFVYALGETAKSENELQKILLLIIICMVSARSAAMGFNRWADKEIDLKNPRTKDREIPKGTLSEKSVLLFVIISSLIFLVTSYLINSTCFVLSFPALAVILFYSYTKRFTYLCHFILGFGIGLAPTGAYLAVNESFSFAPVLWSLGLMFHISGFDILYSTQDIEIDKSLGLKSIPSRFGIKKSFAISRIVHALCFGFFLWAGFVINSGIFYFGFLLVTGILLIVEHSLISPSNLSKLPIAFFHINASISLILFFGILLDNWKIVIFKLAGIQL